MYRILTFCLLLALPVAARAESVAILGLESIRAPARDVALLNEALQRRLEASGRVAVPGKDYVEMRLVYNCKDPSDGACMARAGRSLVADKLVYGTIRGDQGDDKLHLSLRLLNVGNETIERYLADEALTPADLGSDTVDNTARRILVALFGGEKLPILKVTSDPPGAEVAVDDQPQGKTPLTINTLSAGAHTVTARRPGFLPSTKLVKLRLDQTDQIKLKLVHDRWPQNMTEKQQKSLTTAGAVLLGVGGALGVAAIVIWRTQIVPDIRTARTALITIRNSDPDYSPSGRPDFFQNPDGFSCTLDPSPTNPNALTAAGNYQKACTNGRRYSNINIGLWVGTGVLAAAGITSLVIGSFRHPEATKQRADGGFTPRLRALAPSVGPKGGGVSATFEF
ncbi:MAG TPA: PEGA domain-containing protein [Polyangia bacterium]|jgi:hypothetical protein|nr:PEGA domain-containing protein [Polyangia bacterium]